MKTKFRIFLVIFFIIISAFSFAFYKNQLNRREGNLFNLGISSEYIEKIKWNSISDGHYSVTFAGAYEESVIQIKVLKNISLKEVNIYISDKMFVIKSLFREIVSPYPGKLSNRIECPEEFKPLKIADSPFDYYVIYASDRFTYGVCSWDLIKFKSIIYFLYCNKEKKLYHIKLFIPVDEEISRYEGLLKSIGCLG